MTPIEPTAAIPPGATSGRERLAAIVWWLLVATALGAILLFATRLVLPHRPGEFDWAVPGLVIASVVLAALLFQFSQPAERLGRAADNIALVLGLASMVIGLGIAILISVGVSLNFSEERGSVSSRLYRLTGRPILGESLKFAGAAAVPGVVGLGIACMRRRATGRISAAGSAWRFSIGGLAASLCIVLAVGAAALYRWITWGIL